MGMNGKVDFRNFEQKNLSMYSILIWIDTSPFLTAGFRLFELGLAGLSPALMTARASLPGDAPAP